MDKKPVILNVDTGIDDAVAIAMALFSDNLDVKLITCGFGNVEPLQVMKNTVDILHFWNRDIPVVIGRDKPYKRPKIKLYSAHGKTGMGEFKFPEIEYKIDKDYIGAMKKVMDESEEKITIISLSALSNVAEFLTKCPEYKDKIEQIAFMSGSIEDYGDEIPYMEFNGAADPESCEVVLSSGVPLLMCPMEMGHTAYLDYEDVFKTKNMNRTGEMFEKVFRSYKDRHVKNGIATHDGCAVACLIEPEIFKIEDVFLYVKYFDETGTGVIFCDFEKTPNAKITTVVDIEKFKKLYFKLLNKMK